MTDIFTKDGTALKSIYVLGDVGAGKSSFCKYLVYTWCLAHSEGQSLEDEFNSVNEMKRFNFLFYVSLRHCKDVFSIPVMHEKRYKSEILTKILDKESEKIIIVLDGLDEWSLPKSVTSNEFQTEGLPERDISMDLTIITTSRPWKIETLGITDREIQQKLTLEVFDKSSVKEMIFKSVPILNASFGKIKQPWDCVQKLENESLANIKQVPIMLQQLICLWFDDKLHKTSRCAIYTGMLELFISWNDKKKTEPEVFDKMRTISEGMQDVELPQYLSDSKICNSYKYLIHSIARLAYETLFNDKKVASLIFDSSIFEQLEISHEVKTSCLILGILSEDKCPSLSASACQSTVLSFVHKSLQEYLAAAHIAIIFRARIGSSTDLENTNLFNQCTQFIEMYFSNFATLDAVLEEENFLVFLCGLEPRIATAVSKYIYDIVTGDKRVVEYRTKVDDKYRHRDLISNIQECILNSIEEAQTCQTGSQFNFYLEDVFVDSVSDYGHFNTFVGKQYILSDSVRSCRLDYIGVEKVVANDLLEYMLKCKHLETIHIDCKFCDYIYDSVPESIWKVVDLKVSTLKTLSVEFGYGTVCSPLFNKIVRRLPDMKHLVALKLAGATVAHDVFTALCTFLSGTSYLEQISISIACECLNQHEVDLSKHLQLQYLEFSRSVIVTRANTSNLEIFKNHSLNSTNYLKVFDIFSTAKDLNKISLQFSDNSHFRLFTPDLIVYPPVYKPLTDMLITFLSLSHKLRELTIHTFVLTDNIIKSPYEMKTMTFIDLNRVTMSLTTWRKFVDSLSVIPQVVTVEADVCITRDGEECYRGLPWLGGGGEEAAAFRYVREQEQLFNVYYESRRTIEFLTKK